MAIPIINDWEKYFDNPEEGLGSSYERIVINNVISRLTQAYKVQSILECPSFGFTGMSGINLMAEALEGRQIFLEDHDAHRLQLIKSIWEELALNFRTNLNPDYRHLEYDDAAIDMSFNFSAMWYAPDLRASLSEICRVTSQVIMISVPNRHGMGFKMQMKGFRAEDYPQLYPAHIDPALIIHLMRKQGWRMQESDYFDCPPWPDIGMSKEDFLVQRFGLKWPFPKKPESKEVLSILSYYRGEDLEFRERMLKYYGFEHYAPRWLKKAWAHHFYMVFVPDAQEKII
ncbi:MAG TPA: hypothetical protein P5533_05170 [Candidatus Cloacimonadota bacterium]|nr:hypothetical protein [Candidatus Cloacimonadota bacterium]